MKNITISLLVVTLMTACSKTEAASAEQEAGDRVEAKSVLVSESKPSGNLAKDYSNALENISNSMGLLYVRASPEIEGKLTEVSVTNEEMKIVDCTIKEARAANLTANLKDTIRKTNVFARYIRETPSLTIESLTSDETFKEFSATPEGADYAKLENIVKTCGSMKLSMALMKRTGIYDALR